MVQQTALDRSKFPIRITQDEEGTLWLQMNGRSIELFDIRPVDIDLLLIDCLLIAAQLVRPQFWLEHAPAKPQYDNVRQLFTQLIDDLELDDQARWFDAELEKIFSSRRDYTYEGDPDEWEE